MQQQIVQYIKDNLKKGYNIEQIRETLVSSGWNPYQVDEAVSSLVEPPKKSKLWGIIFLATTILVSGFLITSALSSTDVQQPDLIEYSVSIKEKRLEAGDTLKISNILSSEVMEGYALYPTFEITRASDGFKTSTWKEARGITKTGYTTYDLKPGMKAGRYILDATANFRGKELTASEEFYVFVESSEPSCSDGIRNQGEEDVDCGGPCDDCASCSDGIKNQGEKGTDCGGPCSPCKDSCRNCNDYNACTDDKCVNGVCENELIFPCCGNFICEDSEDSLTCPADCDAEVDKDVSLMTRAEIKRAAKELGETDENQAGDFCNQLEDIELRGECLRSAAYGSGNSNFCKYIQSSGKRDACYIELAGKFKDYSVCPLIENSYHQKACEALKVRS